MKDKEYYYVPEIEEFYVGFEYELLESIPDSNGGILYSKEKEWQYRILTSEHMCQPLNYEFFIKNKNKLRVKYLDREDIESLGFKQITDNCFNLPLKSFRGRLDQEVRVLLRCTHVLIYLAQGMHDAEEKVLFTGDIKNKSELKRLLKQLGIL